MKRLLVTGASGYLGAYLMGAAPQAPPGWEVTGAYYSHSHTSAPAQMRQLDLRDAQAVERLLLAIQPQAVIHTACFNRDEANVNAVVPAAQHLASGCHQAGIRLVHVSTDLVFDGEHAPYSDESPPAPITPYGHAKAVAETAVASLCPAAVIVRPSLIWSLDPMDRQTGWLVDGLRRGTPVTLFSDEIRCPVQLTDLTAAPLELAARRQPAGPLNLGGQQALSRWDFGLRLLHALGLARAENVQPPIVAQSGLLRARNLTLEGRRAGQLLATRLRRVDEVLTGDGCLAPEPAQNGG